MEKDLIKAVSELVPFQGQLKSKLKFLKEWSSTGRARSASSLKFFYFKKFTNKSLI